MKTFLLTLLFPSILFAKTLKIAVIDSGADTLQGVKLCGNIDLTKTGPKSEFQQHGNNITHIISNGLEKYDYCILEIKAFAVNTPPMLNFGIAIAIQANVDIINISAGGPTPDIYEESLIDLAIKKGITVIVAAGNESKNLDKDCNYYPACYDNSKIIVVGNLHNKTSNFGTKRVTVWKDGNYIKAGGVTLSGTSQATALETHEKILKLLKEHK